MPHSVELFDALLGKVIMVPEKFQIVLVLNEYGDFLSDMACGLAGSLGIGASANLAFDPAGVVRVALFDAAHGTAPDIAGKNLANPTAIFLALSLLLYQLGEIAIGQAVKNATLDLLREGRAHTRDLGDRNRPKFHRGSGTDGRQCWPHAAGPSRQAGDLREPNSDGHPIDSACRVQSERGCPPPLTTCRNSVVIINLIADPARCLRNTRLLMADPLLPPRSPRTPNSSGHHHTSPRPSDRGPSAGQVLVVTSVMFTFISFWRTAALVLCDLASTAYYIGGIVESQIGKAAPWFILGVMLFSYGVRSIYIESCAMFVRGGVYRIVKEAMGGGLARLAVSALLFDYILTGPISGVTAGQYFIGLLERPVRAWARQPADGSPKRPLGRDRHRW